MTVMRVSELAKRSGVTASALRYYEQRGLLPARRSRAGYRLYDERSVERLAFISAAKRLGLDLDEIGELTGIWQQQACIEVKRALRPRIMRRLAAAEGQARELEAFCDRLRTALDQLEQLPDREASCDPNCDFLAESEARVAERQSPAFEDSQACSLSGPDYSERIERWRGLLQGARRSPAPRGSWWSLPVDRAGEVAELAAAEQECCAFLQLSIDFPPGRVRLHVSAADDRMPSPGSSAAQAAELLGAVDQRQDAAA